MDTTLSGGINRIRIRVGNWNPSSFFPLHDLTKKKKTWTEKQQEGKILDRTSTVSIYVSQVLEITHGDI